MRHLALSFLLLVLPAALGAELVQPPTLDVTPTNVVVHWVTDVSAGTKLEVSPATAKVSIANKTLGTRHTATVTAFQPGVVYTVKLGTARVWLATNTFTAGGLLRAEKPGPSSKPALSANKEVELKAPPARQTWGYLPSLPDHFDRHGADFQAKDAEDYARLAWVFLQRGKRAGLPAKVDEEGVLRVFDPKSRTFAAYNRDGTTKTFFKPEGMAYFDRQPGTRVNLKEWK